MSDLPRAVVALLRARAEGRPQAAATELMREHGHSPVLSALCGWAGQEEDINESLRLDSMHVFPLGLGTKVGSQGRGGAVGRPGLEPEVGPPSGHGGAAITPPCRG
jgi:hypothetical protein